VWKGNRILIDIMSDLVRSLCGRETDMYVFYGYIAFYGNNKVARQP